MKPILLWIAAICAFIFLLLGVTTVASAQGFGTGPEQPRTTAVKRQGGGYNPYTGRSTWFESTHDPATGRMERRMTQSSPLSNQVNETVQTYDPATGAVTASSIQHDRWTGRAIGASRSQNLLTGDRTHAVGTFQPLSGQAQGTVRNQRVDPATGIRRVAAGQFNASQGAPSLGSGYGNRYYYDPFTGRFLIGR
jgi:hypothetical protein